MEVFRDGFLFVIAVVLGVPPSTQFVLMDTGSNVLWVQCEPCVLKPHSNCVNDQCIYSISYGDGAGTTKGVASVETFRFPLKDNTIQPLDGIVFGCSNDNVNIGYDDTAISGIIGLSLSRESLVTQLPDYILSLPCVPLAEGEAAGPSSFLTFGSAIFPLGAIFKQLPLLSLLYISNIYYYYLNLLDISVGRDRIGFPSDTFKLNQDGTGGILIDSGSVSSYLNSDDLRNGRNPYKEVIGAFQKFYDSLNLQRKFNAPTVPQFELCYDMPQGFNHFATMTYHFYKADYIVDGIFANYIRNEDGFFLCVIAWSKSDVNTRSLASAE
ncbi:Aspartic proteinase nepenthesin-2 [Morus notabilis]|uniref:Aspartic proteinase nepenthesin-2 n=1 Tax=Morus notabilis TaxID=981085 RepID=W9RBY9_9ROSA|nr:Aspartic proteinase nepenthesin-2 [Morus notabilis]